MACFTDLNMPMSSLRDQLKSEYGEELERHEWWNKRPLEGFAVSYIIGGLVRKIAAEEKAKCDAHVNFYDANKSLEEQIAARESNIAVLKEIVPARMVPLAVFHYSGTDAIEKDNPVDQTYSINAGGKGFVKKDYGLNWEKHIAPVAGGIIQRIISDREREQKKLEDEIKSQERCLDELKSRLGGKASY